MAVLSRSPKFARLLGALLSAWKCRVVDGADDPSLALVERGMLWKNKGCKTIWLSPSPLDKEEFLTVPISLAQLYRQIEQHFYPTPRRHIRFNFSTEVDLQFDEGLVSGRMVSLSGRGARLSCAVELPTGKSLHVEMQLDGKEFRLPAEVIYSIPAGDSVGREQPHVGVLFKPEDLRVFPLLQLFIEKRCIEAACNIEGISLSDSCLSWFDLAEKP